MSEPAYRMAYVAGATDPYGNTVDSWEDPVLLEGVHRFDPGSSSEPRQAGSDRVIVEPTLYAPYDTPLTGRDKCVVRGVTFEVVGEVRRWVDRADNPTGSVVTLRRVTG